ncbi:MAG: ferrous iron transporter B, partial [Oscillospiraceae bacterium]|nr:ferrous iron transporter B [Oscillospiraceae bacterium]
LAGYSFLIFNLLCAPCFAAMGAIRREMNNPKWTAFAIAYQCVFAYAVSLIVFQIGSIFTGGLNIIGLICALAVLAFICYMLFRPYKESTKLTTKVKVK